MANPVTIYIHHQSYRFLAEEEETYLQQCADIVNKEMDQAMAGNTLSITDGAVLAAMNVADKYCKERQVSDNLRAQLKQALDENTRLARELAEAKREARKAARGRRGPRPPNRAPDRRRPDGAPGPRRLPGGPDGRGPGRGGRGVSGVWAPERPPEREEFHPGGAGGRGGLLPSAGVKVYLTLNTLLTNRELPLAAETGAWASDLGIDAVLVQDLGVARLLRRTCPDLPLHASTQMTVHSLDGVRACADLGMTRVVLSRELSADAIADLCARSPVELEVFGHGALCMCYSGQCFLSAVLGDAAATGACAPSPAAWPSGGRGEKPLPPSVPEGPLLAGALGQLEEMGVACLKIEGRMKRPEYVAVVTGIYAAALRQGREPTQAELAQLEAAFSRQGFTQGYFRDQKGPAMFGTRPQGARDPADLFDQARRFYTRESTGRFPCLSPPRSRGRCPWFSPPGTRRAHTAVVQGPCPQAARTRQTTADQVAGQLRKTGGTVYQAHQVQVDLAPGLSVPLSAVNSLRRQALEELDRARTQPPARRTLPFVPAAPERGRAGVPAFTLSFRRWEQLTPDCLDQGPALVYLPCQELPGHEDALRRWAQAYPDIGFGVVLPRVVWDRELPRLRRELEAARQAGVTQALLGHIGQLPLARSFGLIPQGRLWAGPDQRRDGGGAGPAGVCLGHCVL